MIDCVNVADTNPNHAAESDRPKKFHCHDGTKTTPDTVAKRQLIAVLIMCVLFIIGEATGAALSKSLALFTDVLHMLSDLASFAISLLAYFLATKPNTPRMSFGYFRAEVIGALFSVFLIWLVTGVLCYMAVESIQNGHYINVKPREMLITASIGVVFNIIMGVILHSDVCCRGRNLLGHHGHSHGGSHGGSHDHSHGNHDSGTRGYRELDNVLTGSDSDEEELPPQKHKNINVRAAFIHVIGDFIQSIGVFIAALIIKFKSEEKYRIADPIMTFVFSILVLFTTITVLRDTLLVMMEAVPLDVDYKKVFRTLRSLQHVQSVHNLNIWALTMGKNAVSVHLAVDTEDHQEVLEAATSILRTHFHFIKITIQIEQYDPIDSTSCSDCQMPAALESNDIQ